MGKKKPQATKNKAGDVEKNSQIEKLWAQYGRFQAEREQLGMLLQEKVEQMRDIQIQIAKLKRK